MREAVSRVRHVTLVDCCASWRDLARRHQQLRCAAASVFLRRRRDALAVLLGAWVYYAGRRRHSHAKQLHNLKWGYLRLATAMEHWRAAVVAEWPRPGGGSEETAADAAVRREFQRRVEKVLPHARRLRMAVALGDWRCGVVESRRLLDTLRKAVVVSALVRGATRALLFDTALPVLNGHMVPAPAPPPLLCHLGHLGHLGPQFPCPTHTSDSPRPRPPVSPTPL